MKLSSAVELTGRSPSNAKAQGRGGSGICRFLKLKEAGSAEEENGNSSAVLEHRQVPVFCTPEELG
jgi:hypothetical protein